MHDFFFALSLAPVFKGLLGLSLAGLCFPITGVMVLRLNLIPMRYMLMHGVILGGAISLAFSLPTLPVSILLNLCLVLLMLKMTGDTSYGFVLTSSAAMVFTMAAASMVMQIWDVPAKDTLQLLWGSPFALTRADIASLVAMLIALAFYVRFNFRTISAIFFDQSIAQSLGMNIKIHYTTMVLTIALVVAFAMKLLGALLIDALLVLPVLVASKHSQSLKSLMLLSCGVGLLVSFLGFLLAVATDLPPSATIAILAAILYIVPTTSKLGKGKNT